MTSKKKIQEIKEKILESLEEPKKFKLGDLVGGFLAVLIATKGVNIATEQLKKNGLLDDKKKKPKKKK